MDRQIKETKRKSTNCFAENEMKKKHFCDLTHEYQLVEGKVSLTHLAKTRRLKIDLIEFELFFQDFHFPFVVEVS